MKQKKQHNKRNTFVRFPSTSALLSPLAILLGIMGWVYYAQGDGLPLTNAVPNSWEILPIPRDGDYGSSEDFIVLGKVAIIRKEASPYQTIRDPKDELVGKSTITEEELTAILKKRGVASVTSLRDDLESYEAYDTLVLLGSPSHNRQTDNYFKKMGLSFDRWDDPNTPEDDFKEWSDFGTEGYLLKVGRHLKQNIIILAGYDYDDAMEKFHGAGTFYALQSLRQLIVFEHGRVEVKTAEIADKPLLKVRACMSGFDTSEELEWRNIEFMPQTKVNQNVYWYGNGLAGYNAEATARFRYPWRPDQLELYSRIGKYCRERFVTMVFCMNPDHYKVEWAAAKTFDGSRKDPVHYNPDYPVESEFKKMWGELGFEVKSDIDILAAKFAQLNKAVPGAILTMMNEDDLFDLVHEDDKKLFNAATGDPKQDKINYGRVRAQFLVKLYKRIKELCPDSGDYLPICPPGSLVYQFQLDRNEDHSREFLLSMTRELKQLGQSAAMPLMTTGGGTSAEVITTNKLEDFKRWCNGGPILLHDNNFTFGFHIGAYETNPNGPRSYLQLNKDYPAGYRDKNLYKYLLGIIHNTASDYHVLMWCQSQFMWNMLALDREKVNALATRKVCSAQTYPLLKRFYEEFDNPACYLPDNQPPYRIKVISDRIAFPSDGWVYNISYTDTMRRESQRLLNLLQEILPGLEAEWDNQYEKSVTLDTYGNFPYNFCSVYLANGYIKGWENDSSVDKLQGNSLRDLYLEADDIQQRFFQGPEQVKGRIGVTHNSYSGFLQFIYTKGIFKPTPESIEKADFSVDIWEEGLKAKFFELVTAVAVAEVPDADPRLAKGDWGSVQGSDGEAFRTVSKVSTLQVGAKAERQLLLRIKAGTKDTVLTQSTKITLSSGNNHHTDAVCKPRWINWLLPEGADVSELSIHVNAPIQIYSVQVYKQKSNTDGIRIRPASLRQ